MTPQIILDLTKKHGISALLIFALYWMNARLERVETKLYDCLEDRAQAKSLPTHRQQYAKQDYLYAVLPKETKYNGESKRKMEG